ncbi:FG-GAP-like repeat-containing protein [Nonomuraea sp. NPDC059194]|uniref:FG-GAP-like repeat-containing protein n=1 Tax=Nonomuraea sp. NPDC059194 TaxID=3346764 RepID=UPI0036A1FD0B
MTVSRPVLLAACLTLPFLHGPAEAAASVTSCGAHPSDFDGDGLPDLAIAAPYESVEGRSRAGAVTIRYGSGRQARLSQATPGVPGDPELGDSFGSALAVGDFDGDGCADLAVGVSEEFFGTPVPGADGNGAVQLFHGSPRGLVPGRQLSATGRGSDRYGAALAAGDLDGDDSDELVIGAPAMGAGGAVVVHGFEGRQPYRITQRSLRQRSLVTDQFGAALTTGDFDGDGKDEIAIGAPADTVRLDGQGSVTVVNPRGRGAVQYTQSSPGVKGGAEKWDAFGGSLAAADFDADGRDDLAIGVPGEGLSANQRAMDYGDGMVHVRYGTGRWEAWTQRLLKGSPRYYDRFGAALAAGDFNGDGDAELAVGVPGENAVQVLASARRGGLTRHGDLLIRGRGRDFGAAMTALPSTGRYRALSAARPVDGLVVAAPGVGVVTFVPGSRRPGPFPGLRPGKARKLGSGPGLYGYAFG